MNKKLREVIPENRDPRGNNPGSDWRKVSEPDYSHMSDDEMLDDINSHREALDRPLIPKGTPRDVLEKHQKKIDRHAPYGDDPWEDEDDDNRALP